MSKLHSSISNQNTTIWSPPLTTKSARRSPHCRLHGPSRRSPKAWRVWYNTNPNSTRTSYQRTQLPIYYPGPLRGHYNRNHLHASNRLKIPYCLLVRKSHRPCSRRNPHSNPMGVYRRTNFNNCPRTNLLRPLLFSQH